MPIDAAERSKRFKALCDPIEQKVLEMHMPFPYPTDWKSLWENLKAWKRKDTDWEVTIRRLRPSYNKDAPSLKQTAAEKGIPWLLGKLPFVGSGAAALAKTAIDYCKAKGHLANAAEDPKAKSDFLVEKGMASLIEAVRKVEDAGKAFTETSIQSCSDWEVALKRFYYWRYRLQRLRYYHDLASSFCDEVKKEIDSTEASVTKAEAWVNNEWPKHIFENIDWHLKLCRDKDKCFYPFDKVEISAPFNPSYKPGFIPAGKNAAGPPLPPRNPQLIAEFRKRNQG